MQYPEIDTVQAPPLGDEPSAANLLCAIPGMATTIGHQHHELTELKETFWEITQNLPREMAAMMPPSTPAPPTTAPQSSVVSSVPCIALPEVYHG